MSWRTAKYVTLQTHEKASLVMASPAFTVPAGAGSIIKFSQRSRAMDKKRRGC
jgi:hypothetical protein